MDRLEQNLFSTSVSPKWIAKILLETSGVDKKHPEIHLTDFQADNIGIGAGFLSHILKIHLEWSQNSSEIGLPEDVVVKAPTTDKISAKMKDFPAPPEVKDYILEQMGTGVLRRYHTAECEFYQLAKETDNLKIAIPNCYYWRDTGEVGSNVLVMEDLSKEGGLMNFYEGMTMPQIKSVVREIASLHAYCLTNDDWKSRVGVMPDEQFTEWTEHYQRSLMGFAEGGLDSLKTSVEKLSHHFTGEAAKLTVRSHQELNLPGVMVHGDTWIHNLIFKRKSIGSSELSDDLLAIIDWQMLHVGNLAEDIAVLLVSSVRADLRRKETKNVLRFYYDTLTEKMEGREIPYTLDDVCRAYNRVFSYGVGLYLLFWIPLMGVGSAVEGTADKMERIFEVVGRATALVEDLQAIDDAAPHGNM